MLNNIAIEYNPSAEYPLDSPYSPSENYPEYPFKSSISDKPNPVYRQIRDVLANLGLDMGNFNTTDWNPLGSFINPGDKVVIKPNWVREYNPVNTDISGLITHPSVIRAVLDYCIIALKGKGEITIGDAPIQSADIDVIKTKLQLDEMIRFYGDLHGMTILIRDFRREIKRYNSSGEISEHIHFPEKESIEVNLKDKSFLFPIRDKYKKFRVSNYDPRKMEKFHNREDNLYIIDKSVLEADVIIQIPKLKTHGKAGITCCLKNSVGINGQKDALVHHLKGSSLTGGDAYPYYNPFKWLNENLYELREKTNSKSLQRFYSKWMGINAGILKRTGANPIFEGSWYGNMTLWRMILDITNILFYTDPKGELKNEPVRKVFYIVDGIIGGEKEGPLKPDNKFAGIIAGGWNPVLLDITCARMIGFDYKKITTIIRSLEHKILGFGQEDLEKSKIQFNGSSVNFQDLKLISRFTPSKGWKNHIEEVNL